ncbi:imelysin family protein [uncultured Tenacibaculum sp.]|uniref:imelysin family protein n=1 Tax=uncultured Tenacibaculum sp. TaxID=174713 RepID=UPI0026275E4F|nr:imelysin family protein [uncultured Tenacibaculum sp.]
MNFKFKSLFVAIITATLLVSCSDNNDVPLTKVSKKLVIENYAAIVLQNYKDALTDAQALETAINTFATTPTEANFTTAKAAWKTARESYGTTEAFRFASGPIDIDDDAPEGLLNSWPLDENYIDYVDTDANSGIVNNPTTYPTITKASLLGVNQPGSNEKSVSIGYHAIEFLLWGQDLTAPADKKAGQRAYTDYTTKSNADRRKEYLKVCADLLTDHLQLLVTAWEGSYKTTFLALSEEVALKNMFTGIAILTKGELSGERIFVAYDNKNQEDEHSCFSDNTDRDIRLNLNGIVNVYNGTYKNISGPSIKDLVNEAKATLGSEIATALTAAQTAVNATATPFDFAISDATERPKVLVSVNSLNSLGDKFVEGGTAIGLKISAELPD